MNWQARRCPKNGGHGPRKLLCADDRAHAEWVEYLDGAAGRYRGARLVGNRLDSCLFVANNQNLPPRTWLGQLFAQENLSKQDRMSLLMGVPSKDHADGGRVVCSCFGVGINTLTAAIRDEGLETVEAIGKNLKAGTNCGSCIPELKALIKEAGARKVS